MKKRIGVMQVADTLDLGGYERVAVNLANSLPREGFASYLCVTRRGGPLEAALSPEVGYLSLERRATFDFVALRRLLTFVRENGVRILHAHGPSLFVARAASLLPPYPAVVWHAHFGRMAAQDRPARHYRLATRGIAGVIGVNQPLVDWIRRRLGVPAARVWYVPNLVSGQDGQAPVAGLPGAPGRRVVCVGNLRPEKDHFTLFEAFAEVVRGAPDAQLLLAGAISDPAYERRLREAVNRLGLERSVVFLGRRDDVASLLSACDIGVLSSRFEGLPMALLEYGMAGLPVVSTAAGQCAAVLDDGRAGVVVPTQDAPALAAGVLDLLASPERRLALGQRLRARVAAEHGPEAVLSRICAIYSSVLAGGPASPTGAEPVFDS